MRELLSARSLLRLVAAIVAVACMGVLSVGATAHRTVLRAGYYQSVLDDEDAYTRVYDQVLLDPRSERVTTDLLARLPVPASQVLANLKVVLPRPVLRHIVEQQIAATVGFVNGERSTFALRVDLSEVIDNIAHLAEQYLGDAVASLQRRSSPDFDSLIASIDAALAALSQGRPLTAVPAVHLDSGEVAEAAGVLLRRVPARARARVRPVVIDALRGGDVGSALAAVGPYVLTARTTAAIRDLLTRSGGVQRNIEPALERAGADFDAVYAARSLARLVSLPAQIATMVLGLLAFALLWRTRRRATPAGWLLETGAVLLAGAGVSLAALFLLRSLVGDLFPAASSGWPPALSRLVGDLQRRATGDVVHVGVLAALLPAAVGVAAFAAVLVQRRWRSMGHYLNRHRGLVLAGAGGLVAATLLVQTIGPGPSPSPRTVCLQSAAMCRLRYDQTTFLATHNSMATTADRFLGPFQDPSITDQLDQGARALLIDTHTWERSDQVESLLRASRLPTAAQTRLRSLVDRADPPKPGLWLCHVLCRAGAIALVPTLVRLRKWLDANRSQVLTLIIEDGISGVQTAGAFDEAGLRPYLQAPPADTAAAWPTLGAMVRSNRRLVVFSQRTNGPARWYRRFYDYGMETPFAVPSASALSCAPQRGGTGKRLFLLNNFVSQTGSSRIAAAQVNQRDAVLARVRACSRQREATVNFVAVDFATIGGAQAAVNALNDARLDG